MMRQVKERVPKSLLLYFLISLFGIGSWIAINGIWAEMSILINTLPECQNLPALIVVIIQISNIGPLLYGTVKYLLHRYKLGNYQIYLEIVTTFVLIFVGILASILLSLFWDKTALIFNRLHSVSFLLLAFFLGLVDCTSSVVFVPFMQHFPAEYMSALYIGEGLSGVFPSIAALSQGFVNNNISCTGNYTGHEALGIRFSPNVYFIFLAGMMLLCGMAFILIICLPSIKKHMIRKRIFHLNSCNDLNYQDSINDTLVVREESTPASNGGKVNFKFSSQDQFFSLTDILKMISSNISLYACLGIMSFLTNGALSAISSFALLPYGNDIYHVAINLSLLANPLMSLLFAIFPSKSKVITAMITAIVCLIGIYVFDMAMMSPVPLLKDSVVGKILIVSRQCHSGW